MNSNDKKIGYEKNSLYRFFDIFKNKFWKILGVNGIFFSALLVVMVLAMLLAQVIIKINFALLPFCFLPAIALGPVVASLTRMCRDFAREVPGFFWNDFILGIKRNWKQGLQIATLQYIMFWLLYIAIPFYYENIKVSQFNYIPLGFSFLTALMVMFMSYHMYMMAVSLNLKFREILKNSLIFCFACIFKNFLTTIILTIYIGFVAFLTIYFIIPLQNAILWGILLVFIMLLFFGIIFYIVAFISYPCIESLILNPYYENHPEETSHSVKKEILSDINANKELPSQPSELVYHNGKLIHRSALNTERLFDDREESNNIDK